MPDWKLYLRQKIREELFSTKAEHGMIVSNVAMAVNLWDRWCKTVYDEDKKALSDSVLFS